LDNNAEWLTVKRLVAGEEKEYQFLVTGLDNPSYKIGMDRFRRYLALRDAELFANGFSTDSLNITDKDRTQIDVQCELTATFLVKDWRGEFLLDGDVVQFSAKNLYDWIYAGGDVISQKLDVFSAIFEKATDIELKKYEAKIETSKKPLNTSSINSSSVAVAKSKPKSTKD